MPLRVVEIRANRLAQNSDDAHWNSAGHEEAAQELAKFLARP